MKLAARRGTKRSPSAKGSSLSNDRPDFPGGSTFWAPRHNCRHARRPFFAFAMMSPPPSPLFLLGGRPYLSVECCHTHTHPVHVMRVCGGGSAAKRAARPPQASRPHPRRTILRFENESPTIEAISYDKGRSSSQLPGYEQDNTTYLRYRVYL